MIIKSLVENTSLNRSFGHKHGLCLYIQTEKHKILFDLGPNGLFLSNAKKLGVNIADIDIVIISHGHSDHGRALNLFLKRNNKAKIYVKDSAFDRHYVSLMGLKFSIGLDSSLKNCGRFIFTQAQTVIDDELVIFSNVNSDKFKPQSNSNLFVKRDGKFYKDDFNHEQNLLIRQGGESFLFCGCAHTGITNILAEAEKIANKEISYVIGGFHLFNPITKKYENKDLIQNIAFSLDNKKTKYFTCHCTGMAAFKLMQPILCDSLFYLPAGSELKL